MKSDLDGSYYIKGLKMASYNRIIGEAIISADYDLLCHIGDNIWVKINQIIIFPLKDTTKQNIQWKT